MTKKSWTPRAMYREETWSKKSAKNSPRLIKNNFLLLKVRGGERMLWQFHNRSPSLIRERGGLPALGGVRVCLIQQFPPPLKLRGGRGSYACPPRAGQLNNLPTAQTAQ